MTQTVSRVPGTFNRTVRTEVLQDLVPENSVKQLARAVAGEGATKREIMRARRMIQRAKEKKPGKPTRIKQSTADEISAALEVDAETFLEPLVREDERIRQLAKLGRQADRLRAELGWKHRDFEAALLTQDA